MRKRDLIQAFAHAEDDDDIRVVIADGAEHLDELEEGSVLTIEDTGFVRGMHVIYVIPA